MYPLGACKIVPTRLLHNVIQTPLPLLIYFLYFSMLTGTSYGMWLHLRSYELSKNTFIDSEFFLEFRRENSNILKTLENWFGKKWTFKWDIFWQFLHTVNFWNIVFEFSRQKSRLVCKSMGVSSHYLARKFKYIF